jgi:hypothetical protein
VKQLQFQAKPPAIWFWTTKCRVLSRVLTCIKHPVARHADHYLVFAGRALADVCHNSSCLMG